MMKFLSPHCAGTRLLRLVKMAAAALLLPVGGLCPPNAQAGTEWQQSDSAPPIFFTQAGQDFGKTLESPPISGENAPFQKLSENDRNFRTGALIIGGVGGVLAYGSKNWWQDGFTGDFRTVDEGWFGQDTYAGGADKLGHAYFSYAGTRLLRHAFEWAGNDKDTSIILSAATVLGTLAAVETLDGFSEKWKFSKEDLIMNVLGTGLGLVFEKNKQLDDLIDLRLQYWPSSDARRLNQKSPISDFSGQTYLMVVKASGMPQLRSHSVMRYLELAAGYGSRGYEPNEGTPFPDRHRNLYFGISLNISEILGNTLFKDSEKKSRSQKITDTVLEYVQIPGTAALAPHRL